MAPAQVFDPPEQPPNSLWKMSIVTQVLCLVVSTVLIFMRCYVRLGFSQPPKSWLLEDWLVVISFCGIIGFSVLVTMTANNSAGAHIEFIPNHKLMVAIQFTFWLSSVIYCPVVMCIKLSILLLYRRLLVTMRYSLLWFLVNGLGAFCILYYLTNTFVRIFACIPMRKSWDLSAPGHCLNHNVNIVISGVFNILSDVAILAIPIIASYNLRVKWKKKCRVCALLSFGAMAPFMSIMGLVVRYKLHNSEDFIYIYLQLHLCVMAEMAIGIICVCLPLVPPLCRKQRRVDLRNFSTSFPSSRRPRTHPIDSLLRPSTGLDNADLDIPLPAEPQSYRSAMVAREEHNMLDANQRAAADEGGHGTTDLIDFLALAGRIDDDVGEEPGHELQQLRGVHTRNGTNKVSGTTV